MAAAERVSRSSFTGSLLPISRPRAMTVLPSRIWSDAEWARIQCGYRSDSMDSKWDVFAEGDTVFLHRSWTGRGIYELTFTAVAGGRRISAGVVESDPERFRSCSEEFECLMAELVISGVVLGEEAAELRDKFAEAARRRGRGRYRSA